ncbi:hypothetical protein [Candidatus Clostridium stratigraminis]|uniref:Uncharacterized protein n=1 Tax=Candidatus Clostridium stratigraminis TaxID=3381661 RepID=A0ABW8T6D5_9CLOT
MDRLSKRTSSNRVCPTYIITNEEAELIIDKQWPVIYEHANKHLNDVKEKTSIMNNALLDQRPLEDISNILLDDSYFKSLRRALNPFTHQLKDLIIQLETDSNDMPIAEYNFEKLKKIHLSATSWYKSFNEAVSSYKYTKQMYEIVFINKYCKIL